MEPNWEAIGAIGELIGALAVFLTLIYLAMQIRHNSRQILSQNIRAQASEEQQTASLQTSPDVLDAIEKCYTSELELSFREKALIEAYIDTHLASLYADYQLVENGLLEPSIWKNRRVTLQQLFVAPWPRELWATSAQRAYEQGFCDEVDLAIEVGEAETNDYWALWKNENTRDDV